LKLNKFSNNLIRIYRVSCRLPLCSNMFFVCAFLPWIKQSAKHIILNLAEEMRWEDKLKWIVCIDGCLLEGGQQTTNYLQLHLYLQLYYVSASVNVSVSASASLLGKCGTVNAQTLASSSLASNFGQTKLFAFVVLVFWGLTSHVTSRQTSARSICQYRLAAYVFVSVRCSAFIFVIFIILHVVERVRKKTYKWKL